MNLSADLFLILFPAYQYDFVFPCKLMQFIFLAAQKKTFQYIYQNKMQFLYFLG